MNIQFRKILERIGEKLSDFGLWIEDGYREFRIRRRKARIKRERLRKTLPQEEFKKYRRKELLTDVRNTAAALLVLALLIVLICLLVGFVGRSLGTLLHRPEPETETVAETEPVWEEKEITIGCTGCMLLHSPFIDSYPDEEGVYDFSSIYTYITPYYSAPDYMTCEFEGALGGETLGYSGYPNFLSPDVIIENIRDSGVDLQMLATNHIYDGLSYGFSRTMEVYEEKGIPYTGVRRDEQQKHYYIADIQGIRVGFTDYVYETTNVTGGPDKSLNGMVMEQQDAPLLNSFNYDELSSFYSEMQENIRQMKSEGAVFFVAVMHWGTEYQLQEAQYQQEIAQKLCDMGINAVIGGHPHCEQPIDVLTSADGSNQMFCIYSVGNALSNQRSFLMDEMPTGHTEDGVMVTMKLKRGAQGSVKLSGVDILPTWVYRYQENGSKYFILPLDDVDGLEAKTGISGIYEEALASYERTMEVLGPGLEKAKEIFEGTT
ncbi:MAG: CapA family protein [Eubacteriales bacterium]|nr:CapA family protein [Eubacteriales bacterium]